VSEATFTGSAEASPGGLRTLLSVLAVPVFGFFFFGLGLASGVRSDLIGLLGLTVLTATLVLAVFVVDRARPRERRHLLLTLFSFAFLIRFALPSVMFHLFGSGYEPGAEPNPIPLTGSALARGMLAALLGYAALLAGYALPLGNLIANVVPRMKREWSAETAIAIALLIIAMGWAVLVPGNLGWIPERAGSGVLGTIAAGSTIGIGLLAICYQRYRSPVALLLLLMLVPPTMFFNFFTASKLLFLMPILIIGFVHVVLTRRLRFRWIVGGVLALAIIYPIAKAYREYMDAHSFGTVQMIMHPYLAFGLISSIATTSDPVEYVEQGMMTTATRLDGLGILSVVVRDAGVRVPFQNGRTLAYIPITYVPRLLWPGKPRFETGQWVTDNFGSGPQIKSSTGATWIGELFFNFGWIGVLFGMPLAGVWIRFIHEYFLRIDATIPALLAGVVSTLVLVHGMEADLVGSTSGLIVRISPILVLHVLVRTIMPPPAKLPPPL
jgi:hypothetical protein